MSCQALVLDANILVRFAVTASGDTLYLWLVSLHVP
jgi:hypothetical protein